MYTIKKYANGRFYDTVAKNYITRPQISKLLASRKKISIINTKDGKDITKEVSAQIKAREKKAGQQKAKAKKRTTKKDTGVLVQLLKKGGDALSDYGKKYSSLWDKLLTMSKDEIDRLVKALVKDNKLSDFEAKKLSRELQRHRDNLQKWFTKNVDKRIDEILKRMNLANRDQIVKLTSKINELNKKIKKLETASPLKKIKKKSSKGAAASKSK